MAYTMLRSLRLARRLILAAPRRLGCPRPLHRVGPSATTTFDLSRNYVTDLQPRQNHSNHLSPHDIDRMLDEIDLKIQRTGYAFSKDVEDVIRAVTTQGSLTTTQALLLIRCSGDFLPSDSLEYKRQLVDRVWQLIDQFAVPIDISHYNALLLVNLENELDFSPSNFLAQLKEKNIEPNRVTFQRLIQKYCNKGDIAGATKILEHMNAKGLPVTEQIFNNLIKGQSEAGDVESAVKILDLMKQAGIEPSSSSFTAIMCTHAKRGDINSIRNVLDECKKKEIFFSDKEILEVVYTLAINNYPELVDEVMTVIQNEQFYNREAIIYIYKLLDKNCVDSAFKLLKSLSKSNVARPNNGSFFIKKLVATNADVETIIKYCNTMLNENMHSIPFNIAVHVSFQKKLHHLAQPLMKAWKESGGEIREHFFYPFFVAFGNKNDLQGILSTIRSMILDFTIVPTINTVTHFILPHMTGDYKSDLYMLVENKVPFSTAANSMLFYLLEQNQIKEAVTFMHSTTLCYRPLSLTKALVGALQNTKDIQSFTSIVHYQYVQSLNRESMPRKSDSYEQAQTAVQFASEALIKAALQFGSSEEFLTNILNEYVEKGISINEKAVNEIQNRFAKEGSSQITHLLQKISSGNLSVTPLDTTRRKIKIFTAKTDEEYDAQSAEYQMNVIQNYAKMGNVKEVEELLQKLDKEVNHTIGLCASLIDLYSKTNNIEQADKWFKRICEIDSSNKIDKAKILNYAIALIQNNRSDDALELLGHPVLDEDSDRHILCEKLVRVASQYCPDKVQEFFTTLQSRGFSKQVTTSLLSPIIKIHLDANNIDKAIEKFEWACTNFKITPLKNIIMKYLVQEENAKALQHVTDICTKIHGEINALFDLALVFLECGRPRQARKILETPGFHLSEKRVTNVISRYHDYNQAEKLEDFIQVLSGLYFKMDPLYIMLLKTYGKNSDWEKSLALWIQMQENNVQPSAAFMSQLEKILIDCKQEVPFARTYNTLDHEDLEKNFAKALIDRNFEEAERLLKHSSDERKKMFRLQLVEFYTAENDVANATRHLRELLSEKELSSSEISSVEPVIKKLAETDDFSTILDIVKIPPKDKPSSIKSSMLNEMINRNYLESGKYKQYLAHLDNIIGQTDHEHSIINVLFHNNTAIKALCQSPELEETLSIFAQKAMSFQNYVPLNSLWIHQFINNSPEAEKNYEEHFVNNSIPFYSMFAINACINSGAHKKLPLLSQKIEESKSLSPDQKRRSFAMLFQSLLNSDESEKYDIACECLRHAVKAVGIEKINSKTLTAIENNLTDGQTINSIIEEGKREEHKATS